MSCFPSVGLMVVGFPGMRQKLPSACSSVVGADVLPRFLNENYGSTDSEFWTAL